MCVKLVRQAGRLSLVRYHKALHPAHICFILVRQRYEGARVMATAASHQILPPYISFSTFTTFLDWIKEMPVTPSQIDRSLWETKFAGSVGGQLVPSLRFLWLLDGNSPTQTLDDLARADDDSRKQLLGRCLRRAYGEELLDGLRTDTPKLFDEKLRNLGTTDATHQKASSFFINAAKYAGLELQPAIKKRARNRPSRARTARAKPPSSRGHTKDEASTAAASDASAEKPLLDGLRPVVAALISDLEEIGSKWTESERDSWLRTFQVTLEYAYPAKESYDQDADGTE